MAATSERTCGQQKGGNGCSSGRPGTPPSGSANKVSTSVATVCKRLQVDYSIVPLGVTGFLSLQWRPLKADSFMMAICQKETPLNGFLPEMSSFRVALC